MKNNFKRAAALVLVLCMALSLAACGSKQDAATGEKKTQTKGEVPEYVYASSFKKLDGGADGMLSARAYTVDGAYATSYEKIGREIPETLNTENMSEAELSRFDVYTTNVYFIGNDDTVSKLPDYVPLPKVTNDAGYSEFYSDATLNSIAVDANGNLVTVEYVYANWFDGPEGMTQADEDYYNNFKYEQNFFIRTLDKNGAELSCVPLELDKDQYLYSNIVLDEKGNVVATSDNKVLAFGPDGKIAYTIECENYVESILQLNDGQVYVTMWGDNGIELMPLDIATKTLGEGLALPSDTYNPISGGGDYDLYYTSGMYFYGYDLETQTADKLFNWINCDVNSDNLSNIRVNDDGTVSAVISEYEEEDDSYTSEKVTVAKVASSSLPAKETLTMACMWLDYNVRDMVIKFNRNSDKVRIEILDYSEFNTEDDYEAGATKYLTSVMAGDSADIISLNGLPYRQIASKGLLEDIGPYLDSDKELNRSDLFENVLSALEVEGKLYCTAPSFTISTVMGAVSTVGDGDSWTYDEFDEALAKMPEGCDPFDAYTIKSDMLQTCLSLDMSYYVDWNTGKCNFDSEQFVKLLEFVNRFPDTYEYTDEYTPEDSIENRVRTGKQMLVRGSIYSLDDMYYNNSYFGGSEVNYIGYPTLSGSGNTIAIDSGYAMSSTCKDKDAAWEFLRTFFTEKYQKTNVWSLPTNINVYKDKLAQSMKVNYVTDENGEYVLDENGEKVMEPRFTIGNEMGETINVYAMTQEQADKITAVIENTTKLYDYDDSILSIVQEQAEAYFAGQKSAEDVAKLVQSKANIYVNEQS